MQGCDVQFRTTKKNNGNHGRRLWIIHDEEVQEGPNSAETVARVLAASSRRASINACVDSNSVAGMVDWEDTAWHANHSQTNLCSIGIEHDGYAHQTMDEWLDEENGIHTLQRSAALFREIGMGLYHIEPRLLVGDYQAIRDCVLLGRGSGVCGHRDITYAFKIYGGHTDPGENFPYGTWLQWATNDEGPVVPPKPPTIVPSQEADSMNPVIVLNPDGRQEMHFVAPTGDIWHAYQTEKNGAWTATEPVKMPDGMKANPLIGGTKEQNLDGRWEIYFPIANDAAGGVLHTWQKDANAASGWSPLVKMA